MCWIARVHCARLNGLVERIDGRPLREVRFVIVPTLWDRDGIRWDIQVSDENDADVQSNRTHLGPNPSDQSRGAKRRGMRLLQAVLPRLMEPRILMMDVEFESGGGGSRPCLRAKSGMRVRVTAVLMHQQSSLPEDILYRSE